MMMDRTWDACFRQSLGIMEVCWFGEGSMVQRWLWSVEWLDGILRGIRNIRIFYLGEFSS